MAVDEDVIQRNIQRQTTQAEHHAWAGSAQAVAEAAQHVEQCRGGKTAGNPPKVLHAGLDQHRVDFHQVQHRFGAQQQRRRDQPDRQRQPQCLTHQRADFCGMTGPMMLCNLGRGRQQDSGHQQVNRHPDRVAQGHGCQIPWADTARHHRIDEAHGGVGQLSDHDR